MIFNGREIQSYELELNGNEIEVTEVEIDDCDAMDELFSCFYGITDEMTKKYKESWGQFEGDQLEEIKESLSEHLSKNYVSQEDKPEAKGEYEVGMVLRMTKDDPYYITGKKGSLVQIVELKGCDREKAILKPLNFGGGSYDDSTWCLPEFKNKEQFGLELVEGKVVLNSNASELAQERQQGDLVSAIENASTQELLAEIQKRLGE